MNKREPTNPAVLKDFIVVFAVPTIINKVFMIYFGLMYADHPGDGYGYGLVATILVLCFTMGRLIWKYRHIQDP